MTGKSLAMAYAVKRKKMAAGDMVKRPDKPIHSAKSIVAAIKAKKMADGGMVEAEPSEDEFLSDDMPDQEFGDRAEMFSDDDEANEKELYDPKQKRKKMLSDIFSGVQKKYTGK